MANKEKSNLKNFTWTGVDSKGKKVEGVQSAVSESSVRVVLRSKGISVDKIKRKRFSNEKKIKQQDISLFTRQIATMIKAGIPVIQAFDIVGSGHADSPVGKLIMDIKSRVETGSSLEEAFSAHSRYFDKLYCNLLAAGEQAGILDIILERLAAYQENISSIKRKIKKALMYPIMVLGVAFMVTAVIMIFVIPSFVKVFHSFGAELPTPTLIVIGISNFFVKFWYVIFGAIGGAIYLFSYLMRVNEKFHAAVDRTLLKLPVFGNFFKKTAVSRWCRTLATMFSAGVPLVESLNSVAGASGNYVYYEATKRIQSDVMVGQSLTSSMQKQNVFPPMMLQMTQIGEESGALDTMLNKIAEFYEEEIDSFVANLSSFIEPFIIVFLGTIIGGIVVAMYMPIFKMASTV
jgi:type IV pilus assembly protein PilC